MLFNLNFKVYFLSKIEVLELSTALPSLLKGLNPLSGIRSKALKVLENGKLVFFSALIEELLFPCCFNKIRNSFATTVQYIGRLNR